MARRPTSDIRVSASDALEFEPEPRRRRGIPTTAWLLLVLILVTAAGLGGFLFGDRLAGLSGEESGQVPVVHAAEGAIKVRPDNPGGQDIPFRDYDINKRMQGEAPTGRVENLLPPPEQPRELPQAQAATAPSQVPPVPAATAGAQLAPPAEQSNAEALLPAAPAPAPKPVAPKPMPVRDVAPPPPATVAKAPTPQPAPPPPVPVAPAASTPGSPIALVPKSAAAPAAAAQPAPVAKVAPPPPSTPAATETAAVSGWQVQLAASRAATAAKTEGERMKQKHSDVLGKMTVNIVRADLGAKGVFYRIRLGPARNKDEARAVCAQLAKRGEGCLVIAPGK
ncbi:SPOR domain-containing protein [bacterium SCSIO 12827]|nr:SPOR domain-containing protein [bacterium SCSIO 12827]